jgi:phosphoenolpyruvate-protein phosphotransferase
MAVDYRFRFPLQNGLHARPASHFEALTCRFRSSITLIKERTLYRANARSVLSMVSADVKFDDLCCIHVVGEDEQPAIEAVRRFLKDELPLCDEASPALLPEGPGAELPRSLKAAGLKHFLRGRAVCGGVGRGKLVVISGMVMPDKLDHERAADLVYEQQCAKAAIDSLMSSLQKQITAARRPQEKEVLKAHLAIARDISLWEMICELIATEHRTAAQAIAAACAKFTETLRSSQSAYLRERILDIEDICIQLLDKVVKNPTHSMNGEGAPGHVLSRGLVLTEPSVCVADRLTPGQFLALDHSVLMGLVLGDGGDTSHTVILARSMNIPTVVGISCSSELRAGDEVLVDGTLGLLITEIPDAVRRYYVMEQNRLDERKFQLESYRKLDGLTADHHAIEIGANIASAEEAKIAFDNGAQGIGLFRTEMLFVDRNRATSEDEQTQIYSAAVEAANGRPIIIRLLDIGGDKPAPYLNLEPEDNPFLGYRGVRLYGEFHDLVKAQLRAILKASAAGNIKILVPMVCCIEEVLEVKQLLVQAVDELRAEGFVPPRVCPLGVMIEIPSLAFLMPELCREVDFFSVGSNDLIQYFFAADRANQKVAGLYKWSHPAFLRLMKSVIDQAHAHGKWIGICGEMGDQPAALPLLLGLGFDEISVSSPRVGAMKAAVGRSYFSRCRELANEAVKFGTREEVELLLRGAAASLREAPLLATQLIITAAGITKEEVIKEMTDRLFLAGRVHDPQLLEEAIWKREETYSTGFGYGFALPHCKSEHLAANSIVIAKLNAPVEWGSLDQKPVDVVILLAIRAQEHAQEHMKVFAKLSRLIMRDEFRDRLRNENDAGKLSLFLKQSLEPDAVAV